MDRRALVIATLLGTIAQVAMVVAGHVAPTVAQMFAVGGMGISLLAGLIFAARAHPALGVGALGGAIAGGVCAVLGIAVSVILKDVPASLLLLGGLSSAVTGAIGGGVGGLLFRRRAA